MIFSNRDKDEDVIITTCNCGCGSSIQITTYKDDSDEYYISVCSPKFSSEQVGIFKLIGTRLKRAWYDLIGKSYLYLDICMNRDELQQFIQKLLNITK